jgi:signal transduction histidine kinase
MELEMPATRPASVRRRLRSTRLSVGAKALRALRRKAELLQSTLEHIGEGCSVFDRKGRLVAWNKRFLELLDLPDNIKTETTLREILTYQAMRGDFGSVDPVRAVTQRLGKFYHDLPRDIERPSGAGRILRIERRPMPDGGVISVYSDVTETRDSEQKMVEARKQAELANHAKGEFLANMSHELRTPLNAIIGFAEMICEEVLGPLSDRKYLEYIRDIHATGLHLLSIINDVLDMSKIEAGKLELASEPVIVQQVILTSIRMIIEEANARHVEVAAKLPTEEVIILGDERAIKQVALNLLSNAIKFSKKGGRIEVRATRETTGHLLLEFEDDGIGMTDEELDHAMQPFGQCKPVSTRAESSTGLGLPITKGLVEAHGGTLSVESSVGIGTRVRIQLPALAPLIVNAGGGLIPRLSGGVARLRQPLNAEE